MNNDKIKKIWKWICKPKEEKGFIREWTETIFFVLIMWLIITEYVIQNFYIPSSSMVSTFLIDDRIFVNRFIYRFRPIKRNDVIVFKFPHDTLYPLPEKNYLKIPAIPIFINKQYTGISDLFKYYIPRDFIKRAIGMPGDTLELKNKKVFISGNLEKLDAAQNLQALVIRQRDFFGPIRIPKKGDIIEFSKLNLFELFCFEKYFLSKKINFEYKLLYIADGQTYFDSIIKSSTLNDNSSLSTSLQIAHEISALSELNHTAKFSASNFKIGNLKTDRFTIMEDCYFALGDNRDNSHDSRFWGFVPYSFMKGSPAIIYWPFYRMRINFNN